MAVRHGIPHLSWRASTPWNLTWSNFAPLVVGLALFGLGEGLLVQSRFGATPWAVLALGISHQIGYSVGWTTLFVSVVVLLFWIPLRERPGLGTLLNMIEIAAIFGWVVTWTLPHTVAWRVAYIPLGVLVIGLGSALYLTTGLGPGPRDGLMTSLHNRYGVSVVYVRLSIEALVLSVGWFLGGTVGIATAFFAATIGYSVGLNLALVDWVAKLRG
jgi:uncharacterized membrane protein YczE